jgi:hypothetical protein
MKNRSKFIQGIFTGTLMSGLAIAIVLFVMQQMGFLFITTSEAASISTVLLWVEYNLGLSVVPFILITIIYQRTLSQLSEKLEASSIDLDAIGHLEQRLEMLTGLFFGTGVIWTAIGMRAALLAALGDLDPVSAGEQGAMILLQKLVEGGILTALSTTILGGIGGYLLRIVKANRVDARLSKIYRMEDDKSIETTHALLEGIEQHISKLSARGETV